MIPVTLHIQYLLHKHDCVIIPRLGALITQYEPARIEADGTVTPPARRVSFNADIQHSDGLLPAGIARREGISYQSAAAAVDAAVDRLFSDLALHGSCAIDGVGSLSRDEHGALIFEPDSRSIAGARYAGLPEVTAPGAEAARRLVRPMRPSRIRRWAAAAAAIAIPLLLLLTLTVPAVSELGLEADFAALGWFHSRPQAANVEPETQAEPTFTYVTPEPDRTVDIPVPVQPTEVAAPAAEAGQTESPRCYLIVGSFDSEGKANEWIRQQGEPGLKLLQSDGRVRVYAATGNTVEEASSPKSDPAFASRHPEAWVKVTR